MECEVDCDPVESEPPVEEICPEPLLCEGEVPELSAVVPPSAEPIPFDSVATGAEFENTEPRFVPPWLTFREKESCCPAPSRFESTRLSREPAESGWPLPEWDVDRSPDDVDCPLESA
ncbi:hypothetical protein [Saccharopolyspora gregorii]|uniref:Uncharacterized protein n=1 Tax=Saccharopolyspora gregorii TaxID=33914 RepID=A0ABP6S348_9PSEU